MSELSLLVFFLGFLFTPSKAIAAISIGEKQLIVSGDVGCSDIYGDIITWEDDSEADYEIYMYRISTGQTTRVTNDDLDQYCPTIHGNKMVWEGYDAVGFSHIFVYDIDTGVTTQITNNEGYPWTPDIYGDIVVWTDERTGNDDVYMYNLSTGIETQLTTHVGDQHSPSIYGDIIAWVDSRNGFQLDYIDFWDLGAEGDVALTFASNSDKYEVTMQGSTVYWRDQIATDGDIQMFNILSGKKTQFPYPSRQAFGGVYDRFLVYEDYTNGFDNGDIYLHDFSTGQRVQVDPGISNIVDPKIFGHNILYLEHAPGYTSASIYIVAIEGASFSGSGSGTSSNPYQITTCNQLKEIENSLSSSYILMNDINCNGVPWTPIGPNINTPFSGTLDGNNKTISNVSMSSVAIGEYAGLFAALDRANIYDLSLEISIDTPSFDYVGGLAGFAVNPTIDNVNISGEVSGLYGTGGLIGFVHSGTISNSSSLANINGNGDYYAGGLIGYFEEYIRGFTPNPNSSIVNCSAEGNVSGGGNVGGLVGFLESISVLDSHSTGTVTGTNDFTGGLIGETEGYYQYTNDEVEITNSYASGDVMGCNFVGGLIGSIDYSATILKSYALGNVTTNCEGDNLGGFSGAIQWASNGMDISQSYATGNVSGGDDYLAGFIGFIDSFNLTSTIINNSYSIGDVTETTPGDGYGIGGFVGYYSDGTGLIEDVYSTGVVTSGNPAQQSGGLIGYIPNSSKVINSFWDTSLSGYLTSAGGTGKTTSEMKNRTTFTGAGWDFDDIWRLGPNLVVTSNPSNGGVSTYTGNSYQFPSFISQPESVSITTTATPSTLYEFVNWTSGGSILSTATPYTFNFTSTPTLQTIIANFVLLETDLVVIPLVVNPIDENPYDKDRIFPEEEEIPIVEEPVVEPQEEEPEEEIPPVSEPESEESKGTTIRELINSLSDGASKVVKGIRDLPISEEILHGISTVSLTIIAASPVVSAGLGSSFTMAYMLKIPSMIFAIFGIGKKKRNCGLVYNSITKEPFNNAIVRIFDESGSLVATEVTNAYGFFETSIKSGQYSMIANANGYVFPSKLISDIQDLPYKNIYKGEKFNYNPISPINYSIPLDPIDKSITEYASTIVKNRIINLFSLLLNLFTIIGLIFSIISYIKDQSTFNLAFLLIYVFLITIGILIRRQGKYDFGVVSDIMGSPQQGVEIGLIETDFDTLFAKRVSNENGKYRFIVPSRGYRVEPLDPKYSFDSNLKIDLEDRPDTAVVISEDIIARRKN